MAVSSLEVKAALTGRSSAPKITKQARSNCMMELKSCGISVLCEISVLL